MAAPWLDKCLPEAARRWILADPSRQPDLDSVAAAAVHLLTNDAVTGQVPADRSWRAPGLSVRP
jgi:hypothetical protein